MAAGQWGAENSASNALTVSFSIIRYISEIILEPLPLFTSSNFVRIPSGSHLISIFLCNLRSLGIQNRFILVNYKDFDFFNGMTWKNTFWRFEWYQIRLDIPSPSKLITWKTVWSPTGYLVRIWFTASKGDLWWL